MKKGRLTIPTDAGFVEGTKKYIEYWGADAVRDCDGTELPENVSELAEKVYKTYFLSRSDNEYAYSHYDELQNIAIITDKVTAVSDTLKINLLDGLLKDQVAVNTYNYKKYWQVFDRTKGKLHNTWEYIGEDVVEINSAIPMHEYTVNFFAKSFWNSTQVYNYTCNGWTVTKDRDIDPVYPQALERITNNLEVWLKDNPQVNVVRFTTFFYHFFLLYKTGETQKLFDWYNYAMSASPAMFELFYKEYGYEITLEDLIHSGDYSNLFVIPSKAMTDYFDLVQRFVSKTMSLIVDKVHQEGKEAMMFWGDNWIGAEPYGKYFSQMKLDGIIGSVVSGVNLRIISEIPNIKYKEARLNPYFFPDTLRDEKEAVARLKNSWISQRRAMLRKPVDRIGFGGYLQIADKFPKFCKAVKELCDEFRLIYDNIDNRSPYTVLKIAILSYWGYEKSWMMFNVAQDAPYLFNLPYIGILEAMVGMPIDISFINFDDVKNDDLNKYDIIMNYGNRGTAFTGDYFWKDAQVVEKIKSYIYSGGGFVGIGEPCSIPFQGKFFQLSDVLGVDKELGYTMMYRRYNTKCNKNHFIMEDVKDKIEYACDMKNIYAKEGAVILDAGYDDTLPDGVENCSVKMAVNTFGKGRSFYMTGMRLNAENTRLLYRAFLWCAAKENELNKAFSSNINTECHYYPESRKYAIVNNSSKPQDTVFFDINGFSEKISLMPDELLWIDKNLF